MIPTNYLDIVFVCLFFIMILNPYITKAKQVLDIVSSKLVQLFLFLASYAISVYYSPILGLLLACSVLYIDFELNSAAKSP